MPGGVWEAKRLAVKEYITAGFTHRYCIVAAGDYANTPKLFEAILFLEKGGCVPVCIGISTGAFPFKRLTDYSKLCLFSRASEIEKVTFYTEMEYETLRARMQRYACEIGPMLDYERRAAATAVAEIERRVRASKDS